MTNAGSTMRAIQQDTHGSPDVLAEVEITRPTPGLSEILIAVRAAGVNPTDWRNRASATTVDQLPLVLGWDVSGVVEAVGTGVTLFEPGDEVFGMLPYPNGVGSHAEYVTAPARAFVHKPASIDYVQAGALPLAGLTAYQALVETADVQPGQRVLIHAAAGGVGHLAVQIAKARGAYVVGTASAAKHDFLRSIGADETIDYLTVDFAETVKDIDVVLDPVSFDSASRARSVAVMRPGGTLISINPVPIEPAELAGIAEQGIRFETLVVEDDRAGMEAIAELVACGGLRAHIDATFPLDQAAKAHGLGERGRTTGKIVLTVEGVVKTHIASQTLRAVLDEQDTTTIDRLVRPDYIQHNPLAADGAEGLRAFGVAMRQQFPDATLEIRRALSDGDLVLLHSKGVLVPGTPGMAIFDIFRFEDGKIAEHWDVLQEVPTTTANGNDMFSTLSAPQTEAPEQRWSTAYSKKIATAFFDQLIVRKDLAAIDTYVGSEYHQHNPNFPGGVEGVKAGAGAFFDLFPHLSVTPKRVIAEGDLVAVHSHYVPTPGERGMAVVDLFRVRHGKIVEHWDAVQDVPETSANHNTMF